MTWVHTVCSFKQAVPFICVFMDMCLYKLKVEVTSQLSYQIRVQVNNLVFIIMNQAYAYYKYAHNEQWLKQKIVEIKWDRVLNKQYISIILSCISCFNIIVLVLSNRVHVKNNKNITNNL